MFNWCLELDEYPVFPAYRASAHANRRFSLEFPSQRMRVFHGAKEKKPEP
jgi:hypothetical protein